MSFPARKCPNCGSDKYIETISTESCSACGLAFSYWGGQGGNAVYDTYLERIHAEEAAREQAVAEEWQRRFED